MIRSVNTNGVQLWKPTMEEKGLTGLLLRDKSEVLLGTRSRLSVTRALTQEILFESEPILKALLTVK